MGRRRKGRRKGGGQDGRCGWRGRRVGGWVGGWVCEGREGGWEDEQINGWIDGSARRRQVLLTWHLHLPGKIPQTCCTDHGHMHTSSLHITKETSDLWSKTTILGFANKDPQERLPGSQVHTFRSSGPRSPAAISGVCPPRLCSLSFYLCDYTEAHFSLQAPGEATSQHTAG